MTSTCREIERLGKGIGNNNRYRILEVLMSGPACVSDIVRKVRLSQPAVSQHLRSLKECNLVVSKREGHEIVYSINVAYTTKLLTFLVAKLNKKK